MTAPNILLEGPPGTGKTYSLRTLSAAVETFVIFTEPRFDCLRDVPDERLHWRYIPPASVGWNTLLEGAKLINALTVEALQKQAQGIARDKYRQFLDLLIQMNNFKCDRCNREFGDVLQFGPDKALVIDGLTGISKMSADLTVGAKPVVTQPDWGVMMGNLERFLDTTTNSLKCTFVLIAHLEPERDEVTGSIRNYPSTLGRKLAPKLGRNFDEVLIARREASSYYWSNESADTDTKASRMPLGTKIAPDFGPLLRLYEIVK